MLRKVGAFCPCIVPRGWEGVLQPWKRLDRLQGLLGGAEANVTVVAVTEASNQACKVLQL